MASDVSQRAREALPEDVVALVCAARQILERGYVSTSIADEKPDADALDAALEAFSSRVCYDDDGGTLPEAHADPCTCLATIDNHPLTPKPVDDRGAGFGDHQVLPVDREAYLSLNMLPEFDAADVRAGRWDKTTAMQAFARHREQAERGLREALETIQTACKTELSDQSDYARGWNHAHYRVRDIARKALDTRP